MDIKKEKKFFNKLKKLLGNGTIVKQVGGKKLKVKDLDFKQSFNTNINNRYNHVYQTNYNQANTSWRTQYSAILDKRSRYADYEMMDQDSLVSAVLDIYSEESTTSNEEKEILSVYSDNKDVRQILENLFYDILNIDFNLHTWIRNMCKFGDFYLLLEISPDYGIINVTPLSPYDVEREEGYDPNDPTAIRFIVSGDRQEPYENYEIVHFRLADDLNYLPYGRSIIEPSRRTWKSLQLMEDAMLIYRITRAPERRVFYIDVGNMAPNEVEPYINKIITKIKKAPIIDNTTGEFNLKYNIQNVAEDFFFPTRGGTEAARVDTLPGGANTDAIEDIQYLQQKLFAAWKVPKSFLGFEEELGAKSTLAQEDIRFARTIQKIQRIIIAELTKIAIVHLYSQGFRNRELINFELELTNPSTIQEQQQIELLSSKLDISDKAKDTGFISMDWIYENIFKKDEHEIELMKKQIVEDKKFMYRLEQIANEGNDPAYTGKGIDDDDNGDGDDSEERDLGFKFNKEEDTKNAGKILSKDTKKDLKNSNKPDTSYKRWTGYNPSLKISGVDYPKDKLLTESKKLDEKYESHIEEVENFISNLDKQLND